MTPTYTMVSTDVLRTLRWSKLRCVVLKSNHTWLWIRGRCIQVTVSKELCSKASQPQPMSVEQTTSAASISSSLTSHRHGWKGFLGRQQSVHLGFDTFGVILVALYPRTHVLSDHGVTEQKQPYKEGQG